MRRRAIARTSIGRTRHLRADLLAVIVAGLLLLGTAACTRQDAPRSPSPLPSLTPGTRIRSTGEELRGGVGQHRDAYFRSRTGSESVTVQVLRGVWREEVSARDGTLHRQVLAVALRVTNTGRATWSTSLRRQGELRLSRRVVRRSGRFSVDGGLGVMELQPGEVRDGWLVFENVDWDELRGNRQPPETRFELGVHMSAGLGVAEWLVYAGGGEEGSARHVGLPIVGASVGYMLL